MFVRFAFALLAAVTLALSTIHAQESRVLFTAVDENGQVFKTLTRDDIRIRTKAGAIAPSLLSFVPDSPLNVLIMIDTSASQERTIEFEKRVAEKFIEAILRTGRDRVGILTFSHELGLVHDLSGDFAAVREQLRKIVFEPPSGYLGGGVVVSGGRPGGPPPSQTIVGSTTMFDSVEKVLSAFTQLDPKGGRNVLILICDGVNTAGDKKLKHVIETATRSSIPVYTIGIGDPFYDGVDEKTIKRLAEGTGGLPVFPNEKKDDVVKTLTSIEPSLRNFYVAGFPKAADLQEISVEIVNPSIVKRVRVIAPRSAH